MDKASDVIGMTQPACPCCASPAESPLSRSAYVTCTRCGHRWRELPPQADSGSYYASLAQRNDTHTLWFQKKTAERAAAVGALLTSGVRRILEVGCAEGALGQVIKASRDVVYDGIELSQDANQARDVLDHVFQTPAATIQSAPYDLIVSFHVLEHIAVLETELRAWRDLLAPGGQVLVEVPHRSGHPLLATDLNPEHLHQFTPASLTVLLAAHGLTCHHLSLGHYESPLYSDSMRVLACVSPSPDDQRTQLVERFRRRLGGAFVAYGIGGDFHNYVLPIASILDICALADTASEKWGQSVGPYTITAYDPVRHRGYPILICSIKFGHVIRKNLLQLGVTPELLVDLSEIYDCPNNSTDSSECL